MARKTARQPTREERIAEIKRRFADENSTPDIIAPPLKTFSIGQHVLIGGLKNCRILEQLYDGKAYLVESDPLKVERSAVRNVEESVVTPNINMWWWFDIELPGSRRPGDHEQFKPRLDGSVSTSGLDSLFHMYSFNGLVCNPTYQRGYVWTPYDQEQLIESIFDRMDIGSFVLVRNAGYNYKGNKTLVHYRTIDGRDVYVPKCDNYSVEIIDGQQRLTTLLRFYLGMIKYKGLSYEDLTFRDRIEFEHYSISYRMIEAESVTKRQLLELFLKVNRGVPQTKEHLDGVRKLLEETP